MTMISSSILKYVPEHQVILCMVCEKHYCIPPNAVRDHLYALHENILDKKQRGELVKFAASFDLVQPRDVQVPKRENGPIPLLHKVEGYECLTCGYVCAKGTSMIEHGRKIHQWTIGQDNKWKRQWVQACNPYYTKLIYEDIFYINLLSQVFPY